MDKHGYLGVYLVSSKTFRCAIDNAKKAFYRSFNSVLEKSAVRLLNTSWCSCWKQNMYQYCYMVRKSVHPPKPR